MISAVVSYGLEQNPIAGGWLDQLERSLEQEWGYQPPRDFQPIYILGVPQSGTTRIYEWLCQHSPDIAYFTQGQLSVVDHPFVSERCREAVGWALDLDTPDEGVHEFLAMCNHPLIQGKHGLVAAMDILSGAETVSLGHHKELSSYLQQLNGRIREQQPATFLNRYQVEKFKQAVQKAVFLWRRRDRPAGTFLGKIPAASLCPRLFSYLFPKTRFIHLARAPQQVLPAFMQSAQDIQEVPFISKRPISDNVMASYYGLLTQSLEQEVFNYPPAEPILHLTCEALVADPKPWLAKILNFLGLPEQPKLIEQGVAYFDKVQPVSATPTPQRVEELLATYAPDAQSYYEATQRASEQV